MNNTFTLTRFGHTLKSDLMGNYRTYLMWIGAALGVIAVTIGLISLSTYNDTYYDWVNQYVDPMWTTETVIFIIGFMLISAACASILLSQMADKRDAVVWLTLPSSQLEKFVSRSLICLIIPPVATLLGLGIIDLLRCMIASAMYPGRHISPLFNYFEDHKLITMGIGYFIALQSLFALGSTVFPRRSAIKTTLVLTVIAIVYMWIYVNTMNYFLDPVYRYSFFSDSTEDFINDNIEWFVFVPCCLFAAINYVIAYFRFKESEIIQRW